MGRFGIVCSNLAVPTRGTLVSLKSVGENTEDHELEYSSEDEEETDRDDDEDSSDDSEEEDEEEEEPPHPLGFSSTRIRVTGTCRYSVDLGTKTPESLEAYKRRMGYAYPYEVHETLLKSSYTPPKQQFPPISSYIDPETASTQSLLKCARSLTYLESDSSRSSLHEQEIQEITDLFAASSVATTAIITNDNERALVVAATANHPLQRLSVDALTEPYKAMKKDQLKVQAEVENFRAHFEREHQERKNALAKLLRRQEEAASLIQRESARRDAEIQREAEEQERLDGERRKADADRKEQEQLVLKQRQQQEEAKQREIEETKRVAKEEEAKEREHVTRAQKLVAQLIQLRASVEPFENSPAASVKKRRLQMKKLVGGKINTLTENVEKIKAVAAEVSQAIASAREEDEQVKRQLSAGAPDVSQEMARGKRYLVDLLASKVIVRIQAEGFNGQRGDGFPLANMLAIVSVDNKDINPVLAAHVYTVCPTAIPSLPNPSPNASEDELMESLGMLKAEDGTFETFERFLQRTESIISLVADIMASNPPNHTLFGGHESGIKWLTRFLALLPKAPESPLPLLTAPVLDAFLTGAGHMLANKHPEEFKGLLDIILNDVICRLDEGSIGAPSATRLKKTVGNGFDSFQKTLPSKALPELYLGASATNDHGGRTPFSSASGITTSVSNPFTTAISNPFGGGTATPNPLSGGSTVNSSSPFGGGSSSVASSNSNPFGGGSATSSASPFGMNPNQPLNSTASTSIEGIDAGGMDSGDAFSLSGMSAASTAFSQQSSGFGFASQGSSQVSNPSPFTGTAPSPSPFPQSSSSSPFGGTAPAASPFGTTGAIGTTPAPNPAPTPGLGLNQPTGLGFASQNPSPFSSSNPSPFAGTSTPFGQTSSSQSGVSTTSGGFGFSQSATVGQSSFGTTQSSAPFGTTQPSAPFGTTQPSAPFGTTQSSAPFGTTQPSAPFGTTQSSAPFGTTQSSSPFGTTQPSAPFGTTQSSSSPFGTTQSSAPFGTTQSSAPFGTTQSSSPFGTTQSSSPFGTTQSSSTFGSSGGFSSKQSPGFGGGGFGGSKGRPPCSFFAKGRCKYGDNCRFSHDTPQANTSFGNNPFGGPRR